MGSITFGGLATGIDTDSLISGLMDIERQPLKKLETEKSYYNSRLTAFSTFDSKLKALLEKMEDLDTADEVRSYSATAASDSYFKATGGNSAIPGNYQVEVVSLARQQKDVSAGYASKTDASFGTGTISLDVGGTVTDVPYSGGSLTDIMNAINDADAGVSASIINDGTTGYRLVLTGDDASTSFTATVTETVAGTYAAPSFSNTQAASLAHIKVDGIDIYSTSNSFDEAIPGVTLDVLKTNATDETTSLDVTVDTDATKTKVEAFVSAYNDIFTFIKEQSSADWARDSSFRTVKRKLQDLLVTSVAGSGGITTLAQLGITSDRKDGTISLSTSTLETALQDNLDGVAELFGGGVGFDGIATQFKSYLDDITDSVDGLYASKKDATDSTLKLLDNSIRRMESRLEQREKNLRSQFEALELLVSGLNAQGAYLTQQLASLPTIGGSK